MHKPSRAITIVAAVALFPVLIASTTLASTSPTSPSDYPTSTTTTPQPTPTPTPAPTPSPSPAPTTPTTPVATPKPTPKPAAAAAPAATLAPVPPATTAAFKTSVLADLAKLSYTDILTSSKTLSFTMQGAGTYRVTLSYRKPAQKYRSVAKAAISVTKGGTTVAVPLKANTYAPSTVRYAKHKSQVKLQVELSYELNNRTVIEDTSVSIAR